MVLLCTSNLKYKLFLKQNIVYPLYVQPKLELAEKWRNESHKILDKIWED